MKPAWNYLYEIKVSCGNNNPPSLVGGGVHGQTATRVLLLPGSCVELLTNSGTGDHALHRSCLPVAAQNCQTPPTPEKEVPGCGVVQKMITGSKHGRSTAETSADRATGRDQRAFLSLPSPPRKPS